MTLARLLLVLFADLTSLNRIGAKNSAKSCVHITSSWGWNRAWNRGPDCNMDNSHAVRHHGIQMAARGTVSLLCTILCWGLICINIEPYREAWFWSAYISVHSVLWKEGRLYIIQLTNGQKYGITTWLSNVHALCVSVESPAALTFTSRFADWAVLPVWGPSIWEWVLFALLGKGNNSAAPKGLGWFVPTCIFIFLK